jgi:hypothetical protein
LEFRYVAEEGIPRDSAAEERRDFAVLEAALNDLASPKNPEYKHWIKNAGPGREIVVADRFCTYKGDSQDEHLEESRNIDHEDPRTPPAEIRADFKRRNAGPARSLTGFRPANRNIVVRDLDQLFDKADDPLEEFRKQHPTAWGFVWASAPGYSKDGQTAVVLFEGGPNGSHGLDWTYCLTRKSKRWEVQWRHLRPRE